MLAIDWLVLKVQLQKMLRFDSSIIKTLWLVHYSLCVASHAWLPNSQYAGNIPDTERIMAIQY
jgi:hypothetical protein